MWTIFTSRHQPWRQSAMSERQIGTDTVYSRHGKIRLVTMNGENIRICFRISSDSDLLLLCVEALSPDRLGHWVSVCCWVLFFWLRRCNHTDSALSSAFDPVHQWLGNYGYVAGPRSIGLLDPLILSSIIDTFLHETNISCNISFLYILMMCTFKNDVTFYAYMSNNY